MKALLDNIQQHYETLCNTIGERHLGSTGEKEAADYILHQFAEMGYDVLEETYVAPGWEYVNHHVEIVGVDTELDCYPCFYSNPCALQARPTIIDAWEVANLDTLDLAGKICFVTLPTDVGAQVHNRNALAEELDQRGAGAALFVSNTNDTYNSKIVRTPHLKQMAVLSLSGNSALELAKHTDRDLRISIEARNFSHRSSNIVGRRERGPRKLVVGAHYDTPPNCPGAGDNASGTVALLEVARALHDCDSDYSIDFVAFSGEEYGGMNDFPIGSYMYIEHHRAELDRIDYMFNFDDIGSILGGIIAYTNSDAEFGDYLKIQLDKQRILVSNDYSKTSDDFIFHKNGIPVAFFTGTCNQYLQIHSPNDNLSRMSYRKTAEFVNMGINLIKNLPTRTEL